MPPELYSFTGTFVRATAKAVCLTIQDRDTWLPFSQCEFYDGNHTRLECDEWGDFEPGDEVEALMPLWLVKNHELDHAPS